jgi:CspA family cold shock protein
MYPGREDREGLSMQQGVVKTYDPVTGAGIIVREDDRSEVFIRPGSLQGSVFRTLRQGQRIVFETVEDGDNVFAATIRLGQEGY